MTTPPPSETGPSAEAWKYREPSAAERAAHEIMDMLEGSGSAAKHANLCGLGEACSLRTAEALLDRLVAEAKRSAHLEDARAGCRYCRNGRGTVVSETPVHDGEQWVHLRRDDLQPWESCERPEVWDALSLPPGGQK